VFAGYGAAEQGADAGAEQCAGRTINLAAITGFGGSKRGNEDSGGDAGR
jgi:hypothetical protein